MRIEIYKSISEIGSDRWSQIVVKRFFLSYNYLLTMENACNQLIFRYAMLFDKDGSLLVAAYFQIIPFKGEHLFNYIPQTNTLVRRFIRVCLSWIDTNLLVLGNLIFTCENGVFTGEAKISGMLLLDVVEKVRRSVNKNILGIMISEDLTDKTSGFFCNKGYHSFRVEDRMEMDISHFQTLEEYSNRLQSKYRVRMNKILKLNTDLQIIFITKENFEAYRDRIGELFNEVLQKSKFKLTEIGPDYFREFLDRVDRFKMIGYLLDNEMIAFITYYELDTILEVHYLGMDYRYIESRKIYNYVLYHILQTAIDGDRHKICYGRTAQELKSTLGAIPEKVYGSLKINNPLFNFFTPFFLSKLVPEKWVIRSPFK